jgi:hypothetical protein
MTKVKVIVTEKVCKRCGENKKIEMFRTRPNGFTLNQCRKCEGEMNKERRVKALAAVPAFITVTTKSGKTVPASVNPIVGGFVASSPNTDKILYFNQDTNRDTARIAFSAFANVPRTGIKYQSC